MLHLFKNINRTKIIGFVFGFGLASIFLGMLVNHVDPNYDPNNLDNWTHGYTVMIVGVVLWFAAWIYSVLVQVRQDSGIEAHKGPTI